MRTDQGTATPAALVLGRPLVELVDKYRSTALWFMRKDYYPNSPEMIEYALNAILKQGGLSVFWEVHGVLEQLKENGYGNSQLLYQQYSS